MRQNKLWLIAPALLAVTLFTPSCGNNSKSKLSLNDCSWEQIKEISKKGEARQSFNIGDVKDVTINGITQQVRIIGFNQDKDKDGNQIGITFEFVNLLSDENGYSFATYWQNTNATDTATYDYTDSTLRAVLNGNDYSGSSQQSINWFQYYGDTEDESPSGKNRHFTIDEKYADKPVLSMLPDDLVSVLATPSKIVNVYDDDSSVFTETTVDDKLFVLSPREMGYHKGNQESSTFAYQYYENCTDQIDAIRIKKQIKGSDGARTSPVRSSNREYLYLEGAYDPVPGSPDGKASYAGYNSDVNNLGAPYWLRSPNSDSYAGDNAWSVNQEGMVDYLSQIYVFKHAQGLAPAFCI